MNNPQSRHNQPQSRRNQRRILAVILIFISIIILVSDRQQKSLLQSGRLASDDLSAKIMGVFAVPVRGIESIFSQSQSRAKVFAENAKLKTEIERLRGYEYKVFDLEMRVRKFETLVGVDASSDVPLSGISKQKNMARIVSENNGPFVHSALANIGGNKDVKVGDAVMSGDGLYGHVVRVGKVSSRVLLLNDLNSRISVMSQRSSSRAILVGHNTSQPQLEYIPPESDWQIGDRVVTSGDGGVLPRGLSVGIVAQESNNLIMLDLHTLGQPVDWVWIVPFLPISTPEADPVLPSVTVIDSLVSESEPQHD